MSEGRLMKIEDKLETIEEKQNDLQDGIELLLILGVDILSEVVKDHASEVAAKEVFNELVDDRKKSLKEKVVDSEKFS